VATVNEQLLDAEISHQIDLHKYSNGVVRRIMAILTRADRDIELQLLDVLSRLEPESFTVQRLDALLLSVKTLNAKAYAAVGEDLTDQMKGLVEYEAGFQLQLFQEALPVQLALDAVTVESAYAAAMARPFQGRLLKEWAASIEADRMVRIRDTVRMGYLEGMTTGDIVRRVRGTRAKGYSDGIIEIDRRHAEAVVRTAVSHTAGTTRDRFYDANQDLIKALSWTSTLDSRTSDICRVRDGKQYTPKTHAPIGHKLPWLGGPGRAHWCCRSCSVPVLKSWKELGGEDMPEFTPSTRASMDGQVPADMTYGQWLKKQSADKQDEVLGKAKGAMFRTGKLPLDKFYSDKGATLTLEELKAKQPKAFKKAGLDLPFKPPIGNRKDEIAIFLESRDAQAKLLGSLYRSSGMSFETNLAKVERVKAEQGYTSTGESLAAARYYTGSGYKPINRRMRESGGTLEDRQFSALTASSLPGIGEFKDEIWRAPTKRNAQAWWDRAEVGQPLDMGNQLLSFSAEARVAANVFAGRSDLLVRIEKPAHGAYIEPLTLAQGEHEVLLPPGLSRRQEVRAIHCRQEVSCG
jgi:hypothetical protein